MRGLFAGFVIATIAACSSSALAEGVEPNRLDCVFSDSDGVFVCPARQVAAAQTSPGPAVLLAQAAPSAGTEEWNAWCAAKYRSFDPATGTYRTFNGEARECR